MTNKKLKIDPQKKTNNNFSKLSFYLQKKYNLLKLPNRRWLLKNKKKVFSACFVMVIVTKIYSLKVK